MTNNNKNTEDALQRLVTENSGYNRRIQLIMAELSRNPMSNGLTEVQAIQTLNAEINKLQQAVRDLSAEIVLLQNKLSRSKQTVLSELLDLLNAK